VNAGSLTFYVDGSADGTMSGILGYTADSMGFNDAFDTFQGRIDDARVYNRALSAAEVKLLYSSGR
jgi:hypothetical protein